MLVRESKNHARESEDTNPEVVSATSWNVNAKAYPSLKTG